MDSQPQHLPDLAPASTLHPETSLTGQHIPSIQRSHGLHAGDTSTGIHEGQYDGVQGTDSWFQAQRPFDQSPVYDAGSHGGGQSASVFGNTSASPLLPMGPPTQARKRKAPTLRESDWEPHKARILDLHIAQGLSLPEVRLNIEKQYGFKAELRQYRSRISQWRKDKNVKTHEMQAIVRKRQKRRLVETDKSQLAFNVRGKLVEPQKIDRWMKRNNVAESALYASAPTPSDVGCYTISNRGSPAMTYVPSPPAWGPSPGFVHVTAQISPMSSPALSTVSSIVRPLISTFTGQSPALVHRSLAMPHSDFDRTSSTMDAQTELTEKTRPRYKQYEEARLRDQILQLEASPDSNNEERAIILRQLARVLVWQGRYRAAEDVIRRLLESYESQSEIDKDDDAGRLEAMNILGDILFSQGLNQKSRRIYQRVYRARQRLLGPEHCDTLASTIELGNLLSRQQKHIEAEAMLRRALEGCARVLGREHPKTLRSLHCLGIVLGKQGKDNEAEIIHRHALETQAKLLGQEHHNTLTSLHSLGLTLMRQRKYEEAEATLQRMLEASKKVFGQEHPGTLSSLRSFGLAQEKQGKFEKAETTFQQALEGCKRVLGQEHPDTLDTAHDLAALRARMPSYYVHIRH